VAYTTAEVIKRYLGIPVAADDTLLGECIVRAQAMIDAHTGRTFEAAAASVRYFDAETDLVDAYTLHLDYDLCSITTVTNGDGVVVAASEYVTSPRNATPYYEIRIKASNSKYWTYDTDPENAIAVNGKWAYSATAPADIVQAAVRLVSYLYRQKDNVGGDQDRPVVVADGVTLLPARIPADIKDILFPYVRRV
jgi:hypothetical protein